jgi:hypothetical protein
MVLAVNGTTAAWTDSAPVTGMTVSALTVPPATAEACHLTNSSVGINLQTYYMGLNITATVPTGSRYSYVVQLARIATPNTIIWSHPPTSVTGSSLSYVFAAADIIADQPTQGSTSVDYYVYVLVQLQNSPTWQSTRSQLNIDASNSTGFFGLGAGVYYGSPTGSNSPGGQPGQCTT